jgi:hypothetical protein
MSEYVQRYKWDTVPRFNRRRGLGDDMDDLAQSVADAVKGGDFWSAVALMGGLSSTEVAHVTQKAIALGADPAVMAEIAKSLGQTEVINVTGTAPSSSIPIWVYVAGAGALLWYGYKKKWF